MSGVARRLLCCVYSVSRCGRWAGLGWAGLIISSVVLLLSPDTAAGGGHSPPPPSRTAAGNAL